MNKAANKAKSAVRSASNTVQRSLSGRFASRLNVNATSCDDAAAADASSGAPVVQPTAVDKSPPHRHRFVCCGHREIVTRIVKAPAFDRAITSIIILNTIALSISHEGEPQALTDALVSVNYFVTAVFFVEMVRSEREEGVGGGGIFLLREYTSSDCT